MLKKLLFIFPLVISANVFAQEAAEVSDVEEVVVTGSQIRGAKITGALPVTVITSDDIEGIGVESGDELFAELAEMGSNSFNQTDFSGGYNASRGDVGSLDLRNIGTGNTLTLLNGRRLVQSPGYATEFIGGSYIPVSSVNSNLIPVYGSERIEILRDGAASIYGADAVAGVINTVLKDDFEGFTLRVRTSWYDSFAANDNKASIQWGKNFDDGTNISIYYDAYVREKIRGAEDPKWVNGDLRRYLPDPAGTDPNGQFNDTTWRNQSASSVWGQFYTGSGSNVHSMYRPDDSNCQSTSTTNLYSIPGLTNMCIYDSSSIRAENRTNYGETYDKRGPLDRHNFVMFINRELENGIEAYSEISFYQSKSEKVLYAGTNLGLGSSSRGGANTQPLLIPSTNYWLNLLQRGPIGSTGGDLFVDREADHLWARYFRFSTPRSWDSTRQTWRLVQGFRGNYGDWDWDAAVVASKATSKMNNHGRANLTLLDEALAKSTSDAYNPFCAGLNCGEEAFMTTIFRNNTTELFMVDFKMSNPSVYQLPAGDVGMLVGAEFRSETMDDARDPNINGTITYSTVPEAANQSTFPYISNISNSSPSPDTYGERSVASVFAEMMIPLADNLDSQLAIRAENADDYGSNVVGKLALGYTPNSWLKVRGSKSTSHRAPNLITVNEGLVVRNNSLQDYLYTAANGEIGDSYSIQRVAKGNDDLEAEESTNTNIGIVLTPTDNLVLTVDKWEIATENTVGLFGERNHILLDTLIRQQGGASECTGNPRVIRGAYQEDNDPESNTYNANWDSNYCKSGMVERVEDVYVNLDDRTLSGTDYAVEYDLDTNIGSFTAKFMRVQFDEFLQEASGDSVRLIEASQPGGALAGLPAPAGYGDLLNTFANRAYPAVKNTMRLSWKNGPWDAYLSSTRIGAFQELGVTDNAKSVDVSGSSNDIYACSGTSSYTPGSANCGDTWKVDAMRTVTLTVGYKFDSGLRVRGTIRNLEDERAPLADEYTWGFVGDQHSDYGKSYSLELYKKF
ncbi:TonB-dependent receptor [Gammaproteobacteria bacterium]|nr:TonB-dependent receptor [Gammaproteobacteria bacterium]